MGIGDKLKVGISNAGSRLSQSADESGFNARINEQKKIIDDSNKKAGELMFEEYNNGRNTFTNSVEELFKAVQNAKDEIEKLEAEKQEMIDKAQKERDDRRADAKARTAEVKEKKREEKEKKKEEKKEKKNNE